MRPLWVDNNLNSKAYNKIYYSLERNLIPTGKNVSYRDKHTQSMK
jgi:hypothetical protein